MASDTTVRILVRPDGERLPVLLDRATGQPLFDPLVYVVSQLRGRASNSIVQHLAGLSLLFRFCSERDIELAERVRAGQMFTPYELDALVAKARRRIEVSARRRTIDLQNVAVSRETAANRVRAVRSYLSWLTNRRLHQLAHSGTDYGPYQIARDRLLSELSARLPSVRLGSGTRTGLTAEQRSILLKCIEPQSEQNPWLSGAARGRNFVIVRLLYELGLRRGELLALRLEDFNVRECRLSIVRRPDDRRDPRRRQPVAKTEERVLELDPELAAAVSDYILRVRAENPSARRHGYVFVDTHRGAPLTASGLDKMFKGLRSVRGLPIDLTSHVLRHDWNDRFSVLMDAKRVRPADEMRLRKYLQGWRWDGSAHRYNRRHIVRRANEALLDLQAELTRSEEVQ
jgi:integrase